jgi:hypothetical protein
MPWHKEHFASKAALAGFSAGSAGSGATAGPEAHATKNRATTNTINISFMRSSPFFVSRRWNNNTLNFSFWGKNIKSSAARSIADKISCYPI